MTMTQEEQKALQDLKGSLDKLVAITPESLIQSDKLGKTLDFSKGTEVFARTLGLFKRLKDTDLEGVPAQTVNQLKGQADSAFSIFDQILKFDVATQQNPAAQRDSFISQVQSQYHGHFQILSPVIAYCDKQGYDFEKLSTEAKDLVLGIKAQRDDSEQKSNSMLAEINSTLEKVRRAAAEVGVAQHSTHFKLEAESHLKSSKSWLIACAVIVLLTVGYGAYCLLYLTTEAKDFSSAQSIQMFVAKVMLFSVLYYGIVWTGRMYRAVLHNHIINKHRQNALSTFETFVKAAGDDAETKNAVLLQATQSIFSPQHSGFTSNETESSSPTQILEIVRGLPKQ